MSAKPKTEIYRCSDPGATHVVVCECGARLPSHSEEAAERLAHNHELRCGGLTTFGKLARQ